MRWGAYLFIQKTSDGDYLFELQYTKKQITLRVFESILWGRAYLIFHSKGGGLIREGAYLRGGLNKEITVFNICEFISNGIEIPMATHKFRKSING